MLLGAKIVVRCAAAGGAPARRGGTLAAMPRLYHPNHTAHLRQRLTQTAVHGIIGLLVAAAAAGILAIIGSRATVGS